MMHRLLRRTCQAIAPRVCDDCEGGSGMVFNAQIGAVLRCASCAGTGVVSASTAESERRVAEALTAPETARKTPRSAA